MRSSDVQMGGYKLQLHKYYYSAKNHFLVRLSNHLFKKFFDVYISKNVYYAVLVIRDLSSSGLEGVIASSIQNLTHLQEL